MSFTLLEISLPFSVFLWKQPFEYCFPLFTFPSADKCPTYAISIYELFSFNGKFIEFTKLQSNRFFYALIYCNNYIQGFQLVLKQTQ